MIFSEIRSDMHFRKQKKILIICISLILLPFTLSAQNEDPPFLRYLNNPWVDSVLKTLTPDQQIAQLIWIPAWSDKDISHMVEVSDIIRKYGIGGIIFFQGTPEKQAELTNFYQKISKVPLIIATDGEWGLGMRLSKIEKFPYQMTLGAIQNDSLIYLMGKAIADQFRRLGVNMNLAPVADINNNSMNPVINYRSFGESRTNVTSKTLMYMKGMQDNNILATAKHFPGHGDTDVDSHYDLPLISHSKSRLDSVELYPFTELIRNGVSCIMTAHLRIPALDTTKNLPSTLSTSIINDLLKKQMGFKGLVVTDAMNMKGVTKYFESGVADAKAVEAGNDVIEYVTDVEAAIREIKELINAKKVTTEELTFRCRKILAAKYWAGLNNYKNINNENLENDLSTGKTESLIRNLYASSLTVLNNNQNIIPVRHLESIRIATLAINKNEPSVFQERISKYVPVDHFLIDTINRKTTAEILKKLADYDLIIAGIFNTDQRPGMNFGIPENMDSLLVRLIRNNRCIITYFGNPYAIDRITALKKSDGLILAYQENDFTQDLSAQLIFGGIGSKGFLPVTINERYPEGYGIITPGNLRLQYGIPESAGLNSVILTRKVDSIANYGIARGAYPGCEVMIARKGIVVFQKTYGYQTYENRIGVSENDLYDLASVTKITGPLPGLMLLNSKGVFSPDEKLGTYLPEFRNSNKGDLLMRDMLAHQSGLEAWIPFWKETVRKDGKFKRNIFSPLQSEKYHEEVANGLYINKNYRKKIFTEIKKTPLGEKKFVYSDLTFIIVPEIINKLSGKPWYEFVSSEIYRKIGAFDIGFNPYQHYPLTRIVPTEYDSLFRKQLLHGTVHDEGAAMLGGISGHAGLFATANDMMKLMELYRRMGNYGGEQLISEEVMKEYTRVQFPGNKNRRGLGFDKPYLNNSEFNQQDSYPTRDAPPESFGHSGYTGTFVWIDPVNEISFVFFCNRVYPTRNNNLVTDLYLRKNTLQSIYDSMK
jgi:beta-N-acetylhexosaminidase